MGNHTATPRKQPFESSLTEILSSFWDHNGRVMMTVHRGNWKQAPENSLAAIQYSIVAGADMIEIDVQQTSDGVLILMHDETVDRMTNGTGTIREMTFRQLRELRLRRYQGGANQPLTNYSIPTLEEILILTKNKVMINLDKCWDYREQVYEVLQRTGTVSQALFKSTASPEEVHAFLNNKIEQPLYMQILDDSNPEMVNEIDYICAMVHPQAFEICFEYEEYERISIEVLERIKQNGCRIWTNTMWDSICGGHSDIISRVDVSEGWGWHIGRGVNMIQTDDPEGLYAYLNE
ncbi:hypothetical protein QE450_004609 [Paenibacillus sp. SORGH_AS306]|uniref:glycerophosphodiester phosphodiesterase family protein n=1 Tax=unclassified Paenibacillus TaxID=185978 RepID=UPI002783738F|nr:MULTISPECIES: glycerophosphodiester phosphodiesterase family protein [unclassified Paenibacillus]MDQ1237111.1 hypothetical protein [Paenibacillus sp. SORGH_AS_0306]MDR6109470.1 hypothetical protein [Paenibacillus sp. SORGH_AS_0338]